MIRKATEKDFDFVYSMYMHPFINPYLLYEIMDNEMFLPIYNDLLQKEIKYIYEDEGESIGMFKLVPLTYRASHIAYLGGLAVNPSYSGKGYGYKMLEEIVEFAKHKDFIRIELTVSVTNKKAIHLYTKAGFEKEGIMKKLTYLKSENKYLDEVLMAYIVE
jgi:RimJ/RimL family protein N-acetyltransferase